MYMENEVMFLLILYIFVFLNRILFGFKILLLKWNLYDKYVY